uniref:Uncharacterized protein n=1 Tax=Lactuca sativa TaxID=4236 RepID=A0A9R1UR61_LACSA|nr:hypothetical protein LSAT_V11C800434770 [Lactuca sativa]
MDSFLDMKEGRSNPTMYSIIPMRKWRKGSHCRILTRLNSEKGIMYVYVDDSMDAISEIPILLEWNHEYQLCWNGITNSNSVGITEVDA